MLFQRRRAAARPELLLYSVLNPEPGAVAGTGLLRGLPFVSRILLQIYNTIGQNWSHAGNLRYAVVYRPGNDAADRAYAGQRAQTMARSWQEAIDASSVKDFVAVGDVDVKVIGADNQVLESEIPRAPNARADRGQNRAAALYVRSVLVYHRADEPPTGGPAHHGAEELSAYFNPGDREDRAHLFAVLRQRRPLPGGVAGYYPARQNDTAQAHLYEAQAEKIKKETEKL